MFNSPQEVSCWGTLGNHSSHVSIMGVKCLHLHHQKSAEWRLSLCLLQVLWVLQKSNGADAWTLWKLPPLWLSLWPNRIFHGLQPFLWEILRTGRSLRSFCLGPLWTPQENKVVGGKEGRKTSRLGSSSEHQGNNYPTCWACISFLPFIKNLSLQLSFVVFWASPEMAEKTLSYLLPFESPGHNRWKNCDSSQENQCIS